MLENVLEWLTSSDGGALILVTWFVSWALEEAGWWHALESRLRAIIMLVVAAVIAIVAVVLQNNPALVAAIDPYFEPVYYIILAWLATQTAHRLNTARKVEVIELSADVTVEDEA